MTDDLRLPEGTQILTPDGVYAVIGKAGRVRPETVVRKAALASASPADALTTLAKLALDEHGTARIDLV